MALFIRRVETVVSLKQLAAEESHASTAGGSAQPAGAAAAEVALGPDAPVANIAGARVPKYMFAGDAAPKMSRMNSAADLARVPDVDMDDNVRYGWVSCKGSG